MNFLASACRSAGVFLESSSLKSDCISRWAFLWAAASGSGSFAGLGAGGGGVGGLEHRRWSNLSFAALFIISLVLFGVIARPFIVPLVLAAFVAVLVQPLHRRLSRRLPKHRTLCAALTTIGVLLLVGLPLAAVGWVVVRELAGIADQVRAFAESVDLASLRDRLPDVARRYIKLEPTPTAEQAVVAAVTSAASVVRTVVGAGTDLAIDAFIAAVALYYFVLDGRRVLRGIKHLLPLEGRYFDAFVQEFRDVTYAVVYGNTATAMIQGAVGFVGLLLARVPHPVVWGVAMALVALVPLGGTALVWGPIGVALIASGRSAAGIFVLCWGALVVSTTDNLLRPRLCGSRMALHPLLVFISMFGGLTVFGLSGLLLGPLATALFMAMVRIYQRDFLASQIRRPRRPNGGAARRDDEASGQSPV